MVSVQRCASMTVTILDNEPVAVDDTYSITENQIFHAGSGSRRRASWPTTMNWPAIPSPSPLLPPAAIITVPISRLPLDQRDAQSSKRRQLGV